MTSAGASKLGGTALGITVAIPSARGRRDVLDLLRLVEDELELEERLLFRRCLSFPLLPRLLWPMIAHFPKTDCMFSMISATQHIDD